jgi:hypothetical protein
MGRITFHQLYEETISELKTELQAALVDLSHKTAFDLLLKEAWNLEQAAMGNSTLPTVSDKLNVMASIHNRKLIAALTKEMKAKDFEIQELKQNIISLEDKLNDIIISFKTKYNNKEEEKVLESLKMLREEINRHLASQQQQQTITTNQHKIEDDVLTEKDDLNPKGLQHHY